MFYLTLTVEPTKLRGAALRMDGTIVEETLCTYSLRMPCSVDQFTAALAQLARKVYDACEDDSTFSAVGLAVPDPFFVRPPTGKKYVHDLDSIYHYPIRKLFLEQCQLMQPALEGFHHIPFALMRQGQAFALGQLYRKRNHGNKMYLYVGQSVEAAFAQDGMVLRKARDWMPENGAIHALPFEDSTLGATLSGQAFLQQVQQVRKAPISLKELHFLAVGEDAQALELYQQYGQKLAEAIKPCLSLFAPKQLTFGGTLAKDAAFFIAPLREACKQADIQFALAEHSTKSIFLGLYSYLRDTRKLEYITPGNGLNPEPLSREADAPSLVEQLQDSLIKQLESGMFAKGELFWTSRELSEQYGVSRMTVRTAISALVEQNYLKKTEQGNVVSYTPQRRVVKHVPSLTEKMSGKNMSLRTTSCSMELLPPPKEVQQALGLNAETFVYTLTRVRKADQIPMVYSISYLHPGRPLPLNASCYQGSLYSYLEKNLGIQLVEGKDTFVAIVANETVAAQLEIAAGAPVMLRIRRTVDQNRHAYEYSLSYYPGDIYKYTVSI